MRLASLGTLVILVALAWGVASCSELPTEPADSSKPTETVVGGLFPPIVTIDGVFDASEWMNSVGQPAISLPDGGTARANIYFRNDLENFYLALVLYADLPEDASVTLYASFLADGRWPFEEGDDAVSVQDNGITFDDLVYTGSPLGLSEDGLVGGTSDGVGVGITADGVTVLEISHPLNSGDTGHDMAVEPGDHLVTRYDVHVVYPGADFKVTTFYSYHHVSCVRPQGFRGFGQSEFDCSDPPSGAFSLIDLGALGPRYYAWAGDVNTKGQVVGTSEVSGVGTYHAFIWENGAMSDLGSLYGEPSLSFATAINERGQVVGRSQNSAGEGRATLWSDGTIVDLGSLGSVSYATDINDRGQIVGTSRLPNSYDSRAFLWEDGVMRDLGTLGGAWSSAEAVNLGGQAVGRSATAQGYPRAYVWESGSMTELSALGGLYSAASDINNRGQIVGGCSLADGSSHACLWEDGQPIDLGTLGGRFSEATGINDVGDVVGWSETADSYSHAFLWSQGHILDLGPLEPGLVAKPNAISNRGWIAAEYGDIEGGGIAALWIRTP